MKKMFLVVIALLALSLSMHAVLALASPDTPTLSTEQKQSIQILAQRIELAQLRAQAAQTDYTAATSELTALLKSLNRDGFDLNLQTLAYVPKKPPTNGTK